MRIGFLGGTFDPVHNAHILMAESVLLSFNLHLVLFVPSSQPWMKGRITVTPPEHRLSMLRLAIKSNPLFDISTVDLERAGPSYTVDTIEDLYRQYGLMDELIFIIGDDNLRELPRWKHPEKLLQQCQLVVLPRLGNAEDELTNLENSIPGISERVTFLHVTKISTSSSYVRECVSTGRPIHDMVPEAVEKYIRENRLYTKRDL